MRVCHIAYYNLYIHELYIAHHLAGRYRIIWIYILIVDLNGFYKYYEFIIYYTV